MKLIKLETLKTSLDIGQKLSILGGFIIFAQHCFDIGRLPDVELPSLVLLFGATFGLFFGLLVIGAVAGLLPAFFILNLCKLRRKSGAWKGRMPFGVMSLTVTLTVGALLFVGSSRHLSFCTYSLVAFVILFLVPVVLTFWTKSLWEILSIARSIHTENPVKSPAGWLLVFAAFLVWAFCYDAFLLFLINVFFLAISEIPTLIFAFVFVFLANLIVERLIYDSSSENWMMGSALIGSIVFFSLVLAGPRLVYRPLGVGYISCESGSVLVDKSAADEISRVLPDAIDSKQPMPVAIQKYEVEIVSRIGKEALLELSRPGERSEKKRVFVPTQSITVIGRP